MRLYPDICHPGLRCQYTSHQCIRTGQVVIASEEKKLIPGGYYCREHAAEILKEMRVKLNLKWHTVKVVEPVGSDTPAGATFLRNWPKPLGNANLWNPRYEAYAKLHNRTAEEQLAYDKENYKLYEFTLWITESVREFCTKVLARKDARIAGPEEHDRFTEFLWDKALGFA